MHCDVHYYPAKLEIKIQLVYGETKKINWEVIQTLVIVEESKLIFFLFGLGHFLTAGITIHCLYLRVYFLVHSRDCLDPLANW